jgi:hypothetical protein
VIAVLCALAIGASSTAARPTVYRVDHVADGDTITLRNGQRVRLVQIDTPEVYFGVECYGPQESAITKRLLPLGTRVNLLPEPATDRVDLYGRLLRDVRCSSPLRRLVSEDSGYSGVPGAEQQRRQPGHGPKENQCSCDWPGSCSR